MYLDILNYQKFYLSAIGKFLAHRIENQLKNIVTYMTSRILDVLVMLILI